MPSIPSIPSITVVAGGAKRFRARMKDNGAVLDLTGADVSLLILPGYDPADAVEVVATVESAAGGIAYYDAQEGDFTTQEERWRIKWKVDRGGPLPYLSEWHEVKVVS